MVEQVLNAVGQANPDSTASPSNPDERRRSPRVAYKAIVLVAPYDQENFPDAAEFVTVQTRDLSVNGISFVVANPPRTRSILIVFGISNQEPIIVVSRVVHFLEFSPAPDRKFLVGCEMLKRISITPEIIEVLEQTADYSRIGI